MSGFEYDQTTSWSAAEIGPAKKTQARSTHTKDMVVKAFCDVDNGLLKRTKKNHTQVHIYIYTRTYM